MLRVHLHMVRKEYEAAGEDLLAVLRVTPNDQDAVGVWPDVVQGLTYTLDQLYKAKWVADAERVVALAVELASDQELVRQWNTRLAIGDAGVEELYESAMAAPHDFRSHQLLDYRLASEGRVRARDQRRLHQRDRAAVPGGPPVTVAPHRPPA